MLVLSRLPMESIVIDTAVVTLLAVTGNRAKIGVSAPKTVKVYRGEIIDGGPDLLPAEDKVRNSLMGRLRSMNPEKRERLIRQIVQEFCLPTKELQSA